MDKVGKIEYGKPVIVLIDDTGEVNGGWLELLDIEEYYKKAEEKLGKGKPYILKRAWVDLDGKLHKETIGGRCIGNAN